MLLYKVSLGIKCYYWLRSLTPLFAGLSVF